MTILVLTQPLDITADLVVAQLNDLGADFVRLDTADFPQRTSMSTTIGQGAGRWAGTIRTPHREVEVGAVSAVYYRRPAPFDLPDGMSAVERRWAVDEARHGFGGVLAAQPALWINHPSSNARAAYKPHQLAVAEQCGLTIPRTLVTNDPQAARRFVASCPDGAIYKTLDGAPAVAGWTSFTVPVSADQLTPGVAATAHQFQERVVKKFEVRLTVVGAQQFAARIDAHSALTREDWRRDYDALTFTPIEVPAAVRASVTQLMTLLDLRYGALDFIVTPDGEWVFLEVNPNGQFGFVQQAAGLPIASAIADQLVAADALTTEGAPA